MKKIMSLGGNYFQMTLVKAAKRLGHYVIDVDYLPDNPAHKFADEYHNVSTLDKEGVLALADKLGIDGIVSYASDVSAPTAAYVASKLGLPGNPVETVEIMTNKKLFHPFLSEHGLLAPRHKLVETEEQVNVFFRDSLNGSIMIKPTHGSGSKGVGVIRAEQDISRAFSEAKKYARDGIIVEDFIQRRGYQIAGDAFVRNGEIAFFGLANEHFDNDCNPLVPIGESFPVDLDAESIIKAKKEIEKILQTLGYRNGAVNLDFMFDTQGNVFVIELGPRNGGNLITDAIKQACGVDLAEYTVKSALGEDISNLHDVTMNRFVSSYIWHAKNSGTFNGLKIRQELKNKIIQSDVFLKQGDPFYRFDNGGFGIGAALLEFNSKDEMLEMMSNMNSYYEIL